MRTTNTTATKKRTGVKTRVGTTKKVATKKNVARAGRATLNLSRALTKLPGTKSISVRKGTATRTRKVA